MKHTRSFAVVTISLIRTVKVCCPFLTSWASAADVPEGKAAYLTRTWFSRGAEVNLLKTPSGRWLAVDNDGQFLADESIIPRQHHPFRFDFIQRCSGDYYLARDKGNHGFDWYRVSDGRKFLSQESLRAQAQKPLFSTFGHYFDGDPQRGDSPMAFFSKAKIALVCGRGNGFGTEARRTFRVVPVREGKEPPEFAKNDDIALPTTTELGHGVTGQGFPDHVTVDPDGQGFWYIGTKKEGKARHFAAVHSTPGLKPDGSRTLNLSKAVTIGSYPTECIEAAVARGRDLYVVLATESAKIGGVNAERRLLRINHATGKTKEAKVRFSRYVADVRIAVLGETVAVHDWREIRVYDRKTPLTDIVDMAFEEGAA